MRLIKQAPTTMLPSAVCPFHSPSPLLRSLPLDNFLIKPDQEHRLPRPHPPFFPSIMRTNPRFTANPTTNPFYDPCHVRSAVQLRHLFRNTDVLIDQGFIVADHIFVAIRAGRFNGIGGTGE